jgi:transposase-like protein
MNRCTCSHCILATNPHYTTPAELEEAQSQLPGQNVHFYRSVFSHVPNGKVAAVARMLKAIHTKENRKAAQAKATEIVTRLKEQKLRTAAKLVDQKVVETLTYYAYPHRFDKV